MILHAQSGYSQVLIEQWRRTRTSHVEIVATAATFKFGATVFGNSVE
jgi:hypothetical protein